METKKYYRVLTVDDTPALHEDYKKILTDTSRSLGLLREMESSVFGDTSTFKRNQVFDLVSAFQGEEAVKLVRQAVTDGKAFALAFVDMRMPPGWDGLQTIEELWKVDPTLQIVLCTAYSDNTWEEICRRVGNSDNLAIIKKPFDSIEVYQLCFAMTRKWELARQARHHLDDLNRLIAQRTKDLQIANERLQMEISEHSRLENQVREPRRADGLAQLTMNLAVQFREHFRTIRSSSQTIASLENASDSRATAVQALLEACRQGTAMAERLMTLGTPTQAAPKSIFLKGALAWHQLIFDGVLGKPLQWELILDKLDSEASAFVDTTALMRLFLALEIELRNGRPSSEKIYLRVTRNHQDPFQGSRSRSPNPKEFLCITVTQCLGDQPASDTNGSAVPRNTDLLLRGGAASRTFTELREQLAQCRGWLEPVTGASDGTLFQLYLPSSADSYAAGESYYCVRKLSEAKAP